MIVGMAQYVALLRGINVGGKCRVAMSELKALFLSLGFTEVVTYINSGNVIFSDDPGSSLEITDPGSEIVARLTHKISARFGFPVTCLVRTAENLSALAAAIPTSWQNDADDRTDVLFLADAYDNEQSLSLIKSNPTVDELRYIDGAIIWHSDRAHYSQSGLHKFIGTTLYKNMTARNVNTVRKLAQLFHE
jgi:uncharacterized protein (DUF1697 family)